jgi:hypothetical protein
MDVSLLFILFDMDEWLSRSPSDDLQGLIDVLPLNIFDPLQFLLDLARQFPPPRVLGQVGDELHCVEEGGAVVVEQSLDIGEGAVVEDLYFALVELCERAEEEGGGLSDQLVWVCDVAYQVFYVAFVDYGRFARLVEGNIRQSHADVVLDLNGKHGTSWLLWGSSPINLLTA